MFTMKGIERCEVFGDWLAEVGRDAEIAEMEELAAFSARLNASLPPRPVDRSAAQIERILGKLEKKAESAAHPAKYVPHKYRVRQNRDNR